MPIDLEVTYGGARDNPSGEVWLKFIAPESELAEVAKCMRLNRKQVYLFADFGTGQQLLGVAVYNGKHDSPEWDYKISFKSDVNSLDESMLTDMKKAVVGKSTLKLRIITAEEAQEALAKRKGTQPDEPSEERDDELAI